MTAEPARSEDYTRPPDPVPDPARVQAWIDHAEVEIRSLPMSPEDWDVEFEKPLPDVEIPFAIPEDRGHATLSELGGVEYVEDLIRPGRILVAAAEEGTGKSYTVTGELGIRLAVAGGSFASTWPVVSTGPVLVLSEMHQDDDYARESTILASLELTRADLAGRYYRLASMTAAGAVPALMSDEWLGWIADWLRDKGVVLMVVDTATGASQVDPWGKDIQAVYRRLRALVDRCPALAVALIVHLKKPQGHGERRISDVLGEWGRWCDVVLLLENDGTRTKLSSRKRVRRERRIAATKRDGLLVDPIDLDEAKGTKVPVQDVLAAVQAEPGIGMRDLAAKLGVSKDTASRYVKDLGSAIEAVPTGPKGGLRLYPTDAPPQTAAGTEYGGDAVEGTTGEEQEPPHRRTHLIGAAVPAAVVEESAVVEDWPPSEPQDDDYSPSAWDTEE